MKEYTLALPSVYCDLTKAKFGYSNYFILGALLVSCCKDIQQDLWNARINRKFYEELHFSNLSIREIKKLQIIRDFLDIFIKSKSCFRCLVIKDDKSTLQSYYYNQEWKRLAVIIRTLLSYPYFYRDKVLYTSLVRPRVFIDNENFTFKNENKFKEYFEKTFKLPFIENKKDIFIKDTPSPIIDFLDSKLLDQLQLVDILLGCVRISYEYNDYCSNKSKQSIFNYLLGEINKISYTNITTFRDLDRRQIKNNLINVWEFGKK